MNARQVGVDLGGTTFTVALVDREGRIDFKSEHDTLAHEGSEAVMGRIAAAIRELLEQAGVKPSELTGIGLGLPGLHDRERGVCIYASNLQWRDVPVRDRFQQWFDVPVVIENDVRCAALGERHFGAGRGVDDMVLVTLGTGVGGAVIMGGKLQRGDGFAGEVGHQTIDPDGMLCSCGNRGCLESYAGAIGIVRRARAAYAQAVRPAAGGCGQDLAHLTPKHLSEAAVAGDETARWILSETGRYLGIGLANVVSLLHPKRIVVGGGVARAGRLDLVRSAGRDIPSRPLRHGHDRGRPGRARSRCGRYRRVDTRLVRRCLDARVDTSAIVASDTEGGNAHGLAPREQRHTA